MPWRRARSAPARSLLARRLRRSQGHLPRSADRRWSASTENPATRPPPAKRGPAPRVAPAARAVSVARRFRPASRTAAPASPASRTPPPACALRDAPATSRHARRTGRPGAGRTSRSRPGHPGMRAQVRHRDADVVQSRATAGQGARVWPGRPCRLAEQQTRRPSQPDVLLQHLLRRLFLDSPLRRRRGSLEPGAVVALPTRPPPARHGSR